MSCSDHFGKAIGASLRLLLQPIFVRLDEDLNLHSKKVRKLLEGFVIILLREKTLVDIPGCSCDIPQKLHLEGMPRSGPSTMMSVVLYPHSTKYGRRQSSTALRVTLARPNEETRMIVGSGILSQKVGTEGADWGGKEGEGEAGGG